MVSQTELDLQFRNDELETRIAKLERQLGSIWTAGLDRLGESGYVQFDGIGMRWDDKGMQLAAETGTPAIFFVPALTGNPSSLSGSESFAILSGSATTGDEAQIAIAAYNPTGDPVYLSARASLDGESEIALYGGRLTMQSSALTPTTIASNQNNYNPTFLNSATFLRLSSDASRNITGLQGALSGRVLIILNIGSFDIVLKDEDAASSADYRFQLNGDVTLAADEGAFLWYDATSSRWRMAGKYSAGGGGSGLSHPEVMARNVFGGPY